jgi:hypothetical protein
MNLALTAPIFASAAGAGRGEPTRDEVLGVVTEHLIRVQENTEPRGHLEAHHCAPRRLAERLEAIAEGLSLSGLGAHGASRSSPRIGGWR